MAVTADTPRSSTREEARSRSFVVGGAGTEAIAGAGAVVVTILALAGTVPESLAGIAAIAIGVGLMSQGFSIAAKWHAVNEAVHTDARGEVMVGGGMTAEMIAGVAGITLGILALLGLHDEILLATSAIGFGGALIFGSGTQRTLSPMGTGSTVPQGTVETGAGGELIIGLAAVTLGILALTMGDMTLTVIAFLAVGAGLVLGGTTLLARVSTAVRT